MTTYTLESSREWYNNLPGKRASAAMIIRANDKYLMIKDDYKQAMTFPSGMIDPDESAKHAAIRETHEEVGIELLPDNVTFYSVSYISEHNGFKDRFHFFFIADLDDDTSQNIVMGPTIEDYKWVGSDEIGELSGNRGAYAKLQEMLASHSPIPYFES